METFDIFTIKAGGASHLLVSNPSTGYMVSIFKAIVPKLVRDYFLEKGQKCVL